MSQAAPPSLQSVRIYVRRDVDHTLNTAGQQQQPALSVSWGGEDEHYDPLVTTKQSFSSAADLCAGVRGFAAARGISVAVEEDGRCAVFARM